MVPTPDNAPRADEPGAPSQPEGDGPVTLDDRTEPGGAGSPDTNQGRTEPLSPTPDHPEPAAVPALSDMNVGSADPQAPSHPAALGRTPGSDASPAPAAGGGGAGGQGAGGAAVGGAGQAQRAPGSLGVVPAGESVETDVTAGAARMAGPGDRPGLSSGHGDTGPAPDSGDAPLEGSSEQQQIVTGTRSPRE